MELIWYKRTTTVTTINNVISCNNMPIIELVNVTVLISFNRFLGKTKTAADYEMKSTNFLQ